MHSCAIKLLLNALAALQTGSHWWGKNQYTMQSVFGLDKERNK